VSRFPAAFRLPVFASQVILSRQGCGPSSRLAYQTTNGPDPDGVSMFRTRETRPGWVPPMPRGRRCSPGLVHRFSRRLPLPNGQSLNPAPATHRAGTWITRCQRRFTIFTRPVFPSPVAPGWNGSPRASLRAPDPAVTSDARRSGDRPLSTGPELRCRHHPSTLLSSSSLAVCDLTSHV
jgi:hypothetical protein